jgi:type II secretory pathway pseudopilin PulG
MELMITVAIMGILAAIAVTFLWRTRLAAREITLKHDLSNFVTVQEAYYVETDEFAGDVGLAIRNDGVASGFSLPGFLPSDGVAITIIAGDPFDPYNEFDPMIVQARYGATGKILQYNFATKEITEM